ncbi:FtsB family cell division protein [Kitasatospora kifunensis]|uniref:Cell division protein FtsB n=1 Tax=Kitasatospora kifunensis TaxID=58351 RepID=A0A7W7R1V8_KITKI|nr:septum formation initiator family protein [Kitasatospora kifunensis]MBB4923887.1 cell division protein FtsB [Kitasatospora kifunensis]
MARWKIPGLAGRPRFTSRATVLVLVLCSLVAILAYPTRQFMNQRAQINDQRVKAEQARQQVEQLTTQWARWQDPMFVKAQARERLHYALPGETPFVSVDPTPSATPTQPSGGGSAQAAAKAAKPWYATVWDSVDAAAAPVPAP